MKQIHLNIFLIVGIIICCWLSLRSNEKEVPAVQQIDYKDYERRFNQLQIGIDSLRYKVNTFEQKTDTIKLQILRDETNIKNLDNHGIDSAFAVLLQSTK